MKFLFLLSLVTVGYGLSLQDQWHSFKLSHGKRYTNLAEERFRRSVFADNQKKIQEHNKKYEMGQATFKLRMNRFGDLMSHEFRSMMNRFKPSNLTKLGRTFHVKKNVSLPESIDWRDLGAVTTVKDQGKCGSCWSFSATGALEGQHFRKTGKLVSLSEQNLIDCSSEYGNDGCHGGLMDNAFEYIADNEGVDTENSYPYEGQENECRFSRNNVGATASSFMSLPEGDEEALLHAVATVGPVSAGVDAGHHSFQFYAGGVYHEFFCSSYIDHAVLIVGYGTEDGLDYWLVKNSWNTVWGEDGYVKMARNRGNHCGIANRASYPII